MSELDKRLAELTPEKREILARLLKEKGSTARSAPSPASTATAPGSATNGHGDFAVLDNTAPREPTALKASWKQFYDTVSAQLASNGYGEFSFFLNYGYVADGQPEFAAVPLPEQYFNRNSVKLVLELIGDCPIDGKRVLDVGWGR